MIHSLGSITAHQHHMRTAPLSPRAKSLETIRSNIMPLPFRYSDVATLQVNELGCLRPVPSGQTPRIDIPDELVCSSGAFGVSTDVFMNTADMGCRLQRRGDLQRALLCFRGAMRCKFGNIHSEHPTTQAKYADILFEIGMIYTTPQFRDDAKSLEAIHECLDLRRDCLGSRHSDVAAVLYYLASVHSSMGEHEYGTELLVESLSILLSSYPSNTNALIDVWTALANVQEVLGESDDAESSLNEVLRLKQTS